MSGSGFVADDLSDLSGFWRGSKPGDRDAARGTDDAVCGGIGAVSGRRLSCVEAAEPLGISERHLRRLRDRYEAEGAEGLIDWRRGRTSGRRAACIKHERVVGRDKCVPTTGGWLQIAEQRHRRHFVKVAIQVHEYPDATIALLQGPAARRLH